LRYWVSEARVDGFRFDLGTILAREPDGFNTESGFLKVVGQDPLLAEVKLIAEPWDCGPGGYQVGGFPPGWAEWNDRFRDDVRDFWRGHASAKTLAPRLCASADKFNFRGRKPWASVNFVAAHDGFTLRDLVSYNDKHNEANGEDNRDGHSDNRSWNCGAEGPTDDKDIQTLRQRQLRNLLATLILSQGTPMISAGDEFGRTQGGNNNAYCQDNATSWVHWDMDEERLSLVNFFRQLTSAFHLYPVLRRSRFLTGDLNPAVDVKDASWIDATGLEMTPEAWDSETTRCFGMLLDGRGQATGIKRRGADTSLLLVFNAHHDVVNFTLPPSYEAGGWKRLFDTTDPQLTAGQFDIGAVYEVTARSMLLFERVPDKTGRQSAK
jgi:isoamylase